MMDSTNDDVAMEHCEEEEKEDEQHCFCTLAVTGSHPTFQAIFVCNEFSEAGETDDAAQPTCVCQACAEVCRDDGYHEVEYIGMGPSYCDCSNMGNCKLHEKSLEEAERLGVIPKYQGEEKDSCANTSPEFFVREAFDIPMLQAVSDKLALSSLLVEQAQELIKYTKETHWIDETMVDGQKQICLLESLAWSIYRLHKERYKDTMFDDDDGQGARGGAEWWVQVKNIYPHTEDTDEPDSIDANSKHTPLASSSIDLHYDKDEALAESFGIGSFPALSTVTYLTAAPSRAAPTIIFDHTYTQGEDEVMSSMMVSRPRIGKHICFDGRLLHGAPYHPSLLSTNTNHSDENSVSFRVTFLVNIWKNRRPASVHVLDDKIRNALLSLPGQLDFEQTALRMTPLEISKVFFEEEKNIPEPLRDRIELPFVSNLAEDDDGEDNNGGSTVVVTFPPPQTEDCVLVTFGAGLQAYIDYNYGPEEIDDEGEIASMSAQADDSSFFSFSCLCKLSSFPLQIISFCVMLLFLSLYMYTLCLILSLSLLVASFLWLYLLHSVSMLLLLVYYY